MPATPTHSVYLVVSKFGGVSKATAYHSSVMVDGREYSFGMAGICFSSEGPTSHCSTPRLILMGTSSYSGYDLLVAVSDQFGQGTYDLIRKNCNSWTDVALFFLLRQRLDQQYRALERIGSRRPSFVQAISIGKYTPNPLAANFDLEQAVARVAADTAWPAPATALPGEAPCEEADCHSFFDDAASTAPSACGDPPQATSEEGTASVQSQGADLGLAADLQAEGEQMPEPLDERIALPLPAESRRGHRSGGGRAGSLGLFAAAWGSRSEDSSPKQAWHCSAQQLICCCKMSRWGSHSLLPACSDGQGGEFRRTSLSL